MRTVIEFIEIPKPGAIIGTVIAEAIVGGFGAPPLPKSGDDVQPPGKRRFYTVQRIRWRYMQKKTVIQVLLVPRRRGR